MDNEIFIKSLKLKLLAFYSFSIVVEYTGCFIGGSTIGRFYLYYKVIQFIVIVT